MFSAKLPGWDRIRGFRGAALAGAVALLLSCGAPPPPPPSDRAVLSAFGLATDTPPEPVPAKSLELYIDGSESMRGFVGDPNSRYGKTLTDIYTNALTAKYDVKGYKVSTSLESLGQVSVSQLVSPGFYSGGDTPLSSLLNRIASQVASGSICALVTDMVQSELHKDQKDMIHAMQAVAQASPAILLVAFRSGFKGKYFLETEPHGVIMLDQPDDAERGRPFFLLIASPSRQDLVRFQKYVLAGLDEAHSFQPSAPPMEVTRRDVRGLANRPSLWDRFRHREYAAPLDFFTLRERGWSEIPLVLRLRGQTALPLRSPSSLTYGIEAVTFRGNKPLGPPRRVTVLKPEAALEGGMLTIKFPFASPESRTWDAYRIRILAGEGNLKSPAWVDAYSTLSDRDTSQGNRTLHLNLLVQAMVRAITEEVVFSDHVICLRGE